MSEEDVFELGFPFADELSEGFDVKGRINEKGLLFRFDVIRKYSKLISFELGDVKIITRLLCSQRYLGTHLECSLIVE